VSEYTVVECGAGAALIRYLPNVTATYCTNLRAPHLAQMLEEETGIPLYDTASTTIWMALKQIGVDTTQVHGWGRLFSEDKKS
jgi:maleate isomerase